MNIHLVAKSNIRVYDTYTQATQAMRTIRNFRSTHTCAESKTTHKLLSYLRKPSSSVINFNTVSRCVFYLIVYCVIVIRLWIVHQNYKSWKCFLLFLVELPFFKTTRWFRERFRAVGNMKNAAGITNIFQSWKKFHCSFAQVLQFLNISLCVMWKSTAW
jgi:hypothetical protein